VQDEGVKVCMMEGCKMEGWRDGGLQDEGMQGCRMEDCRGTGWRGSGVQDGGCIDAG